MQEQVQQDEQAYGGGDLSDEEFLALEAGLTYPPAPTEEEIADMADEGDRGLRAAPRADVTIPVPYIHQLWDTADSFTGEYACGPTSVAMVLAAYGLLDPKPLKVSQPFAHENPYGWYVSHPFSHGGRTFDQAAGTPDGNAQGLYGTALDNVPGLGWVSIVGNSGGRKGILPILETFLEPIGNTVQVIVKPTEEQVKASLDEGHPFIISGDVFTWGHILVIRGYYHDHATNRLQWIINDPYGFEVGRKYDGPNVAYSWGEIHHPRGRNRGASKYGFRIRGPVKPTGGGLSADSPLLGAASGRREALARFLKRTLPDGHEYTDADVELILGYYWQHAPATGVDPFLAVLHSIQESNGWQSPEAARPHRNPARLGQGDAPGGFQSFATWELAAQAHLAFLKLQAQAGKRLRDLPGADALLARAQEVARG